MDEQTPGQARGDGRGSVIPACSIVIPRSYRHPAPLTVIPAKAGILFGIGMVFE